MFESRECTAEEAQAIIRPVKDALDVLNGRWRLAILVSLCLGEKRFGQIAKEVVGITDRVLSKELKDLELNGLVRREIYDEFPVRVIYQITGHGKSLQKVLTELYNWGNAHRGKIMKKQSG